MLSKEKIPPHKKKKTLHIAFTHILIYKTFNLFKIYFTDKYKEESNSNILIKKMALQPGVMVNEASLVNHYDRVVSLIVTGCLIKNMTLNNPTRVDVL